MQMFCQASAHLRCALLQGNSQVLYKPECVFITHLRMASWRAQLPKHASALQSVCAQNRVTAAATHPRDYSYFCLTQFPCCCLETGPGGLHGHVLACKVKPSTKKNQQLPLSASSYPLTPLPSAYWCWRSICLPAPIGTGCVHVNREGLPGNPGKPGERKR